MPKLQFYDHGKQFSDHRALCEALVVALITFIISFVASKPTDDCLETCNLPVSWSAFKALPAFPKWRSDSRLQAQIRHAALPFVLGKHASLTTAGSGLHCSLTLCKLTLIS